MERNDLLQCQRCTHARLFGFIVFDGRPRDFLSVGVRIEIERGFEGMEEFDA